MSFLDFIPTADEVFDFITCRVAGHTWKDGRCTTCGKKESP